MFNYSYRKCSLQWSRERRSKEELVKERRERGGEERRGGEARYAGTRREEACRGIFYRTEWSSQWSRRILYRIP